MNTKNNKKVFINKEACKACGLCIEFCPDKALSLDDSFNSSGQHPVKWRGDCRLCGMCFLVCPDVAIEVKDE